MSGTVQHGTYTRYARMGCRCPMCREYQRAKVERSRAARLAAGSLSHGTRSAYDAGCRCSDCSAARRDAYKRLASEGAAKARRTTRYLGGAE